VDISLNTQVVCADGPIGRCTHVVVNFRTWRVTHLVVKAKEGFHIETMVPVKRVAKTNPSSIQLNCSERDLAQMAPFTETQWITAGRCSCAHLMDEHLACPDFILVNRQRITPDEVAVHRGTRVEATDGRVGRVEKLRVCPVDWQVTDFVLCQGHLWGQKRVIVPSVEIDRIGKEAVYLKMDKRGIKALPATSVRWP
jgi:hypothetical protein